MDRGAWWSSAWGHKELDRTEWLTLCNCEHAVWCSQKIKKRRGLIIKCIIFLGEQFKMMLVISSGSCYTSKYKPGDICVVTPPFILVLAPSPSPWTSQLPILSRLSHLSRQDPGVRLHAGNQGHQDILLRRLHHWCCRDQPLPGFEPPSQRRLQQANIEYLEDERVSSHPCSASSVPSPAALSAHLWAARLTGQRAECSQVNGTVWGTGNWLEDDDWVWWLSGFLFYCCLVAKSCPTLCNPLDCSTPVFSVPHHLLKFVQVHVHWISDAIQPSHPLSSPSPPAFSLSPHQGLFRWVGCSHQVAKVLELKL